MAKNDFKSFPAFRGKGVLTKVDDPSYAQAVTKADTYEDGLVVGMPNISPIRFPTNNLTVTGNTGRLAFVSAETPYRIRELREDDGEWLSKYKTLLPVTALEALIRPETSGEDDVADQVAAAGTPTESLDALADADGAYVTGVLYTNDAGRWARIGGNWVLVGPNDLSGDEDTAIITIDPNRADEFLDKYDHNYVSVADAQTYEDPQFANDDMSGYSISNGTDQ